jgi:DNA topoisomerase I
MVRSCVGHIRELPSSAKRIPAKYKHEPWSRLGVDIADGFRPLYVLIEGKKKIITELKAALRDVDELILATDEDREGEAISWHLVEVLKPSVPIRRAVFHEITPEAITEGLSSSREIDINLVEAQETRRILDRLAGYTMSPLIWKKIAYGLSAGRVQSVALSLIVRRENERLRFVPAHYCDAVGAFTWEDGPPILANLVSVDGRRVARGSDFDPESGQLLSKANTVSELKPESPPKSIVALNKAEVHALIKAIRGAVVADVQKTRVKRRPPQPFITSTLQQECGNKLGMSAGRTMRVAQSLYENGHISYMRTDNPALSDQAIAAAQAAISERYGTEFLWDPEDVKLNRKKPRSSQGAHEAIRPAGLLFRSPETLQLQDRDEQAVYDLIFRRTLASQMAVAQYDTTTIGIDTRLESGKVVVGSRNREMYLSAACFRATGRIVVFPGFLRAYEEYQDEIADNGDGRIDDAPRTFPDVISGSNIAFSGGNVVEHTTVPRPRYTDASLVKELEVRGVGRPSTYASIIEKLVDRSYVFRGKALGEARTGVAARALVPSLTAFAVDRLLSTHFPSFVDPSFTSHMEEALDTIAAGNAEGKTYLAEYYLGDQGLAALVERNERDIDNLAFRKIILPNLRQDTNPGIESSSTKRTETALGNPDQKNKQVVNDAGEGLVDWSDVDILVGPHGPYIEHHGKVVVSLPRTILADELSAERLREFIKLGKDPVLGHCPDTGTAIIVKSSKYGPYVQFGRDEDMAKGQKPKRQGLLSGMDVGDLSVDLALQLLSLPRLLGTHPKTRMEMRVGVGPFGPYIVHEGQQPKYVNIKQDDIFSIQFQEALELLADAESRREKREAAREAKKIKRVETGGTNKTITSAGPQNQVAQEIDGEIEPAIEKSKSSREKSRSKRC